MLKKVRLFALGIALLALPVLAVACGDDDGDTVQTPTTETPETPAGTPETETTTSPEDAAADVEEALRDIEQAEQDGDVERYLNRFTDNALQTFFGGSTREEVREALSEGFEPSEGGGLGDVENIEVTGDSATADAQFNPDGQVANMTRVNLLREGGVWRVDSLQPLRAEVPEGVAEIQLDLEEFRFVFDAAQIVDGNIAFDVTNTGQQQHEVTIARIPEDLDVAAALQAPEEPEGVEEVGHIGRVEPGVDTNVVFTEPLAAGRYVLLCFIPDTEGDGTPHAMLGMWAEFTVE